MGMAKVDKNDGIQPKEQKDGIHPKEAAKAKGGIQEHTAHKREKGKEC